MRKLFLPAILFVIYLNHSSGQTDFRDGFNITLGNDTVKGKLDFRSNAKNYNSCLFMDNRGTREYFPDQIKAFGYLNDKFFSSHVVENSFVEVLVYGDISLYKHMEHFLIRKGDQLHTLVSKKAVTDENGKTRLVKDPRILRWTFWASPAFWRRQWRSITGVPGLG